MRMRRKFNQIAVYWPPNGLDKEFATQYDTPVEIRVRWEDCAQNMMDALGEKWTSMTAVNTVGELVATPGEFVRVSRLGILWLGRLVDANVVPLENVGAATVRQIDSIPSRKATQTLYTAYL